MKSWLRKLVDSRLDKEKTYGVPSNSLAIDQHLSEFFDDEETFVIHEKTSEIVHSDVFVVKPDVSKGRDFYILITAGLSAIPMVTDKDYSEFRYGELMMMLPSNWNVHYDNFNDENNYWPFRLLIGMTKYPHDQNTWLGYGHTYANSDNDKFSLTANFSAVILLDSMRAPETFLMIKRRFKRNIHIHAVIPVYSEELEFKLTHGTEALLDKFENYKIDEVIDLNRVNTCA